MTKENFLDREFMQQLEQLSLVSRKVFRGLLKGERLGKKKGISVEFADYRDYVPGDDLRFLDWNIYGRLERLFLKLFQEEEDLNVFFLVDCSKSMDYGKPSKLDYCKKIIAALGYIALVNLDRVAVGGFSNDLDYFFPLCRGKNSAWHFFQFLEELPVAKAGNITDLYCACRSFSLKFKGSSMVIVLSDFMDRAGFDKSLALLTGGRRDVFVFNILSHEEMYPSLAGDLKLMDLETGEDMEVSISARLLTQYQSVLKGYLQSLQQWCLKHNVLYLQATNQEAFENLVLRYLRHVGMLR